MVVRHSMPRTSRGTVQRPPHSHGAALGSGTTESCLGVEKHLRVQNVLGGHRLQVRPRDIVEVHLLHEHLWGSWHMS